MSDINNISPFSNRGKEPLSEERLMAYLEGRLSPAEQHEIEQWMTEDGMESDALEGLHSVAPEHTRAAVNRLKHDLRKTIVGKKNKRKPLKTDLNTVVAIVLILLLAVIAYVVIRITK